VAVHACRSSRRCSPALHSTDVEIMAMRQYFNKSLLNFSSLERMKK
jgi:hypothetical protein